MKTTLTRMLLRMTLFALLLGGVNARRLASGSLAPLPADYSVMSALCEGPGPMPTPPVEPGRSFAL